MDTSDTKQLSSADDVALAALSEASQATAATATDETAASDSLAETLTHLQNILERYATELETVGKQIKEKRESMQSIFENDSQLSEAQEQAQTATKKSKERKSQLNSNAEVVAIKNQLAELAEQRKEIEETISNHLLNYYKITNSKSFDTSDGDQWDFDIKARVKPRRKA